jgi:ABC-2 type transport system ATP-binding protein
MKQSEYSETEVHMLLLQLQSISKSFGRTRAVDGLSLSVEAGEIVGLIGPNGSGKSTTLGVILGLVEPDAGSALVCDIDPQVEGRAARDEIGYVPDEDALIPNLTANEHLEFVGLLHGVDREVIVERSRLLLDLLELQGFQNQTPEAFSFGMRKKLQLACSLIHEPDLLVLDEPLNGLDVESAAIVRMILEFRKRQERSTLLATHNLQFAERVCDRIYLISKGRLLTSGDAASIVAASGAQDLEDAFMRLAVGKERHDAVEQLLARI